MNSNDFVNINHVLTGATSLCLDSSYKKNSRGWYISHVQDCIQKLAIETLFLKKPFFIEIPKSLSAEMPKDCINIEQIYLYNESEVDCCESEEQAEHCFVPVSIKLGFDNKKGETSRVSKGGPRHNSFNRKRDKSFLNPGIYCNIQNGRIMFSSDASVYSHAKIIAHSMGGEIGEMPIIPRIFETAVRDYVISMFWQKEYAKDHSKRRIWIDMTEISNNTMRQSKITWKATDKIVIEQMNKYYQNIFTR